MQIRQAGADNVLDVSNRVAIVGRSITASTAGRIAAVVCLFCLAGCSSERVIPTAPTPQQPPPPPPPAITITAPILAQPASGTISYGWPTFTWNNATKTNTDNALVYRLDMSTSADFSTVAFTTPVPEGANQTSYTPLAVQLPPTEGTWYWRVIAIDQANAVQSAPSAVESFRYQEDTWQNRVALQLYGGLWTRVRPPGSRGRVRRGPGWDVAVKRSFDGFCGPGCSVTFQSPPLEILQTYDLLELGMSPTAAIGWMRANGYATTGVWYPENWSIGFPYQYMTLLPQNFNSGNWELVHRSGR